MRLIRYLLLMLACSAAVAGEQDITVKQGAQLNVTLTGSEGTLTGRTLRMHVRSKVGVTSTKFVASTTTGELSIASASSATLTVGADVLAAVPVTLPVEYWVYDVESYTTSADVRREWWGRVTITRDVTRDTEAATETALAGVVLYSGPQSLTTAQKTQARDNIGAGTGGGGGGSGDVVGPASATDDRIAAFDSTTGKLIKQGSVTATAVASHMGSTSNPHSVTAAQVGADAAGTAAAAVVAHTGATDPHGDRSFATSAISTHAAATDPHGDRAFATSAVSTHAALTTGAHGITAAGAALLDDADAAAQRTTLGLGTAATQASSAFEASGAVSTHNAVTTAHGISAFGATLVDDAAASNARTTLGLGTAATSATGDFEAAGSIATHAALTSSVHGITATGAALIDDASTSAQRTTMGVAIGSDVQGYDADLTTWAGVTPGTGVATFLATPSSANLATALTDETGIGAAVFASSPTLTTPSLGTPSALVLTNATGLPPAAITQSGATSNQVLAWNGSAWAPATPSAGSGDVVGPSSSTDNALARYDTTTGKLLQNSGVTVSDVSGSSVTLASTAGNALAIAATAPAATTGASVAGKAASLTAAPAVASTDTAGAAAGGSVTITAGAAARLTSGNADGGSINLVPGAGIGTGRSGQILIPAGSAATPALSFSNDSGTDTGLYSGGANYLSFALGGTAFAHMSTNEGGFTLIGNALLNYTRYMLAATTSITEPTYMRGGVTFNSGATALVTRTLPGAAAGAQYTYVVMDSDGIKIQAASGDEIRAIDKVTAAAGYIQSTTIGSVVCLLAVDSTTWVALHIHGVWTDSVFTYDDTSLTTP